MVLAHRLTKRRILRAGGHDGHGRRGEPIAERPGEHIAQRTRDPNQDDEEREGEGVGASDLSEHLTYAPGVRRPTLLPTYKLT